MPLPIGEIALYPCTINRPVISLPSIHSPQLCIQTILIRGPGGGILIGIHME